MQEDRLSFLSRLASRYQRLIDYFIPESLSHDRDASNQARMFLISHTVGPILGNSVPLALFIFDPTPGIAVAVLALGITAFWVFPFLLRWGVRYDFLVLASVVNLNFCIFWSCFHYGGVTSPTLPWVLIIPILSLFYIGGERRLQPHLLAITAASFAVFLAAYSFLDPGRVDIPLTAIQGLGIVSTTAALCYVATMAIYYARIFDAGVELEMDVRRRRQATDELRLAVAATDRAGAMKTEFLARMSHELRTPLNSVIGYSQMLKEDAVDCKDTLMEKDVDRIHEAGQYLLRLINMILDLAKIESGRIQFDIKECDVAAVIDKTVANCRELVDRNGNTITTRISEEIGKVETDNGRFQQLLEAIVSNAAQYTRRGTINVQAFREKSRSGTGMFKVEVSDTGPGIDPATLPMLFDTFVTNRDASGGRFGGTGLNLSVTHKLCRAMGGEISVKSTLGVGSKFTVTLPVVGPAATAANDPEFPSGVAHYA
jgi:signal transduction histidine kinase